MDLNQLLKEFSEKDIKIVIRDGKLLLNDPHKRVTDEMRAVLRANKEDIIAQFSESQSQASQSSVQSVSRDAPLPLSFAQQRIWFIDKLSSGSSHFNLPQVFRIEGEFKQACFEQAMQSVVDRHEVLRTTFREDEQGNTWQHVHDQATPIVNVVNLSALSASEQKIEVQRLMAADADKPFDLTADVMLRATVLTLSDNESVFLINMHHIASDGISLDITLSEIQQFYLAALEGRDAGLEPLTIQYADYAAWQHDNQSWQKDVDYWKGQLKGLPDQHSLALDNPRPAQQTFAGHFHKVLLGEERTRKIRHLCKGQDATLFMFIQTALSVVLSRYSHNEDIVVGTPVSGRFQQELESLIGCFLNMVILRTQCDQNQSFNDILTANKETILNAWKHQSVPYEMLVETLNPARSMSYNPLYQIMLVLQSSVGNGASGEAGSGGMSRVEQDSHNIKHDLEFYAYETDNDIQISWLYNVDLFNEETIRWMATSFDTLIDKVLETPNAPLNSLMLLTPDQVNHLVHDVNQTAMNYDRDLCIHQVIEQVAAKQPEKTAVVYDGTSFSYQEINEKANQLARILIDEVGENTLRQGDQFIGLCTERSAEMLIGALAIMKVGAAYLPLDPAYPVDRLAYMLEDSQAKAVITKGDVLHALPVDRIKAGELAQIDFDDFDTQLALDEKSTANLTHEEVTIAPGNLAYVIYTSGSTGKPKGVCIEHRALNNLIHSVANKPGMNANDKMLGVTSIGFDIAGVELYLPLSMGAELHIASSKVNKDGMLLCNYLNNHNITFMQATPSTWQMVMLNESWKPEKGFTVMCGGEAMTPDLANQLLKTLTPADGRLFNMYGPTETTIWSARALIEDTRIILGEPMDNTDLFVLDTAGNLAGIGCPGELCIGGEGLARGYLNRDDLTAKQFIQHPFSDDPTARIYRTGDLVRRNYNDEIEFMGRIDHQVKVRGFRIELGEIEARLSQVDGVQRCAVLAPMNESGDRSLVAFLVADSKDDQQAQINIFKETLARNLPDFMIPGLYVFMDEMPQTPNGKIDRKALPVDDAVQTDENNYVAPRTDTEGLLVDSWQAMLQADKIGINDNFFLMGGHSLMATRLISTITEKLNKTLTLRDWFESPTIAALAVKLDSMVEDGQQDVIATIDRDGKLPLSHAQKRLWFIEQLEKGSAQNNINGSFIINGDLHTQAVEQAVETIIERHEVLRTTFAADNGNPQVVIHENPASSVAHYDLTGLDEETRQQRFKAMIETDAQTPFDIATDTLLRVQLIKLSADRHGLLFNMHHIASDGWSLSVLVNEFVTLYDAYSQNQANPLAPLSIQYLDFAGWQNGWLQGDTLTAELDYWTTQLADLPQVHNLPLDAPRPAEQGVDGLRFATHLSPELSAQINALCQSQDVTLFMLLQTAFSVLVANYSHEDDIVMGSPIAGRQQQAVEDLIGLFVNNLVLRTDVSANPAFDALLATSKEMILSAYSHQNVPFEMLVETLNPARSLSHAPLFQILFTLQNNQQSGLELSGMSLEPVVFPSTDNSRFKPCAIKFDLELYATELNDGESDLISLDWHFNSDLFQGQSIETLAAAFEQLLSVVVAAPSTQVKQLNCLTATHQQQLDALNTTDAEFPQEAFVFSAFEQHAAEKATEIALRETFDGATNALASGEITFGELNAKANQMARYLTEFGVAHGDMVGICLERSIDLVITMLAITKAGAAYVSLDPHYPSQRIAAMLDDSGLSVVITRSDLADNLPFTTQVGITLDCADLQQELAGLSAENVTRDEKSSEMSANSTACVIYTSGSTGKPKGVLLPHRSIVNRIHWMQQQFPLMTDDKVAMKTSVNFVDHIAEIFHPLSAGISNIIFNNDNVMNVERFVELIDVHQVSRMTLVPSLLKAMLDIAAEKGDESLSSLSLVVSSGEALTTGLAQRCKSTLPACSLLNFYGSTEVGADVTWFDTTELAGRTLELAPMGQLVANNQAFILNDALQPVALGAIGELYVSGAGLATGYTDKQQTAQRFVEITVNNEIVTAFKTGDLVRVLPDGLLAFIGRVDHQVKVRGMRIELAEIESVLNKAEYVDDSLVLVIESEQGSRLVSFLVSTIDDQQQVIDAAKDVLKRQLPDYMIPQQHLVLTALPLTPNGKLDRNALEAMVSPELFKSAYVAPQNESELILCQIWQQLLGLDAVGTQDNFFELGGHSLLATRVLSAVREKLGAELSLKDLFAAPRIADLAAKLETAEASRIPPITVAENRENLPLSFGQQRLWFVHQLEGSSAQYNINGGFALKGELDKDSLRRALNTIIERHTVLRTSFRSVDGLPQQFLHETFELPLFEHDWRGEETETQEHNVKALMVEDGAKSFDLANDVLIRVNLVALSDEAHILLFNMHHIVSDGWSLGQLVKEFAALYTAFTKGEANPLAPLAVQYADYANWQRNWLQGDVLEEELSWWKDQLADIPQAHNLRMDKPRPALQTWNGDRVNKTLTRQEADQLQALCKQHNVTLFMLLQTAFAVLVGRYSNETDVVIGSPIAGRDNHAVEDLIGFFVNNLVLRTDLAGNPAFTELLAQNRDMILQAYDHQHVPFDMLVDGLNPVRSRAHSPLFQLLFVLQNNEQAELNLPGLTLEGVPQKSNNIQFDIELYVNEIDGTDASQPGLVMGWHYNTDLFNEDTIKRLSESFNVLLRSIISAPATPVQSLDILSDVERYQLTFEWNDTQMAGANDLLVHQGVERQAENHGEAIALYEGDKAISFTQLNDAANRLAHYLIKQGVAEESLVGLCVERSTEMVVAMLAVIKAGAAYVSLDPNYPAQRLQYMVEDSALNIVLTQAAVQQRLAEAGIELAEQQLIALDDEETIAQLNGFSVANPDLLISEQATACIIYTSGTTGQPKGVMLPHASIINRIEWMQQSYPLTTNELCCQKTSLNFVDHIAEVFHPLSAGVSSVIIAQDDVVDVSRLIAVINEKQISRITLVPSLLKAMLTQPGLSDLSSLKLVVSSGEALPVQLVTDFSAVLPDARLLNLYGSTEVGADVTAYELTHGNKLNVVKYFQEVTTFDFNLTTEDGEQTTLPVNLSTHLTQPNVPLEELMPHFQDFSVPDKALTMKDYMARLNETVMPYLVNVSADRFIGHMTSALPDFMPEFSRMIAMFNQNMVKVETSKSLSLLERQVLAMTHQRFFGSENNEFNQAFYRENIQNPYKVFGIITSGGSLANITLLQVARNKALMKLGFSARDIGMHGAFSLIEKSDYSRLVILSSRLAHYSVRKAAIVLGIGEENIRILEQDENQKVIPEKLEQQLADCKKNKELVIAIVGIAGATETGTVDPLPQMHAIAKENDIHFHVDAAWGGVFQFSDKNRHRIRGVELADSITLCAHKQLFLPQGISLCLLRDVSDTGIVSTHTHYQAQRGSFDLGQYSLEGSRPALSLLLHSAYHLIANEGYAELVDKGMDNTLYLADLIEKHEAFELVGSPQTNILNYRYIPRALRGIKNRRYTHAENEEIGYASDKLQKEQFLRGQTFVSRTKIVNTEFSDEYISVFRVVLSNPLLTREVFHEVLKDQISIANEIIEGDNRLEELLERVSVKSEDFEQSTFENWSVPIGKPIGNSQVYLLDSELNLVPVGAKGELYVAGTGLASGYLNKAELTEKAFIQNPFSSDPNSRLYKTGDVACWLPDGNLEYLGRTDNQVKLRGLRIEISEIEHQLLQHADIEEAAVALHSIGAADKQLVGWIKPTADAPEKDELLARLNPVLASALPDYMIPQVFVVLEELPKTPGGKLDRKRLPAPSDADLALDEYIAPSTELETTIQAIWQEVLKRDEISVQANYFALGGHSLLATVTVNRISEALAFSVPVAMLFEFPTIATLASAIQAMQLTLNDSSDDSESEDSDDDLELTI